MYRGVTKTRRVSFICRKFQHNYLQKSDLKLPKEDPRLCSLNLLLKDIPCTAISKFSKTKKRVKWNYLNELSR